MHSQVHVCTWRYSLSCVFVLWAVAIVGRSQPRPPLPAERSGLANGTCLEVRSVPSARATVATLSSIFWLSQGEPIRCDSFAWQRCDIRGWARATGLSGTCLWDGPHPPAEVRREFRSSGALLRSARALVRRPSLAASAWSGTLTHSSRRVGARA